MSPTGWCYTPRQEARTFEEAEHVCRAWGGHVLSFQDQVPHPNPANPNAEAPRPGFQSRLREWLSLVHELRARTKPLTLGARGWAEGAQHTYCLEKRNTVLELHPQTLPQTQLQPQHRTGGAQHGSAGLWAYALLGWIAAHVCEWRAEWNVPLHGRHLQPLRQHPVSTSVSVSLSLPLPVPSTSSPQP
jgi:hypothetical protein